MGAMPMKTINSFALCMLVCVCVGTVASAQKYAVADLGVLPGDASSVGGWINNLGHVAGCSSSYLGQGVPCSVISAGQHAFFWTEKKGLLDMGTLPGGQISNAYGISDSDEVVGCSSTKSSVEHAYRWTRRKGMEDLGTLPGGTYSVAAAISSLNEIVGWSDYQGSLTQPDAVMWGIHGVIHDLGHLSNAVASQAGAINIHHHVVGTNFFGEFSFHAFFWTLRSGMKDLGTLPGGSFSYTGFLNDNEIIVGGSDSAKSPGVGQCVMWDTTLKIHEVATYMGGCGLLAMNDMNQAVGQGILASGSAHAILWSKATGKQDLNKGIPKNSGWVLNGAESINNAGQIVGWGTINGAVHAFLLTPKK
jgi:probable HAF family extracellular repeat protein